MRLTKWEIFVSSLNAYTRCSLTQIVGDCYLIMTFAQRQLDFFFFSFIFDWLAKLLLMSIWGSLGPKEGIIV
jgi:hypothetical protein